jgi:hypothetical protein
MNLVDLGWFLEEQIRASMTNNPNITETQIEQAVQATGSISPAVLGAIGSVTSGLFVTIIYCIHALYLTGASFVRNDGIRFGQWFALICWAALPTLLGFLASIVNLLTNDVTFMAQTDINPLSIGSIFGLEATPGSTSETILFSYDLTSIWSLILIVLGYQVWTKKPLVSSALIALGPYLLIIALGVIFSVL